jgi:hypothetical protein
MSTPHDTGVQNLPPLNLPPLPDEIPVARAAPPAALEEKPKPKAKTAPAPKRTPAENPLYTLIAWVARCIVGVFICCNIFPLSFITAIAVFGWLQRRMQAIALRGWWHESPRRADGSFQDFLNTLGPDAPVERPRWFWRERIFATLDRQTRGNTVLGFFRAAVSIVTLPVHSLWLNFKTGVTGLFATYMLTGWGCSMMLFSWYFGWLNSFNKGYEDAFLGALFGLFGSFMLILALIYVPMAQAHQAAAGEISAFFQFRIVTRLILARLTAYVMLTAGFAFLALLIAVPRFFTASDDFWPNKAATPQEGFVLLELWWLAWTVPFFFAILLLRSLSALIYRSAMLKAVRAGTILISDLPPRLALWFDKLEIVPQAQVPEHVLVTALKTTISWKYRAFMFGVMFFIWLLFVMWFYFGYFIIFNEYRGVLNHPVVQVPCIDWTPWHLVRGEEE